MSKLEELIAELCPDGVKYVAVKDCVDSIENIKWIFTDGKKYQYIDLTSVDRDTHLITETQVINKDNAPSRARQIINEGDILLGATRPMLKRYCMITENYDNQVCSTGFCVLRAKTDVVLRRWLYHQISSTAFFDHVERFQKGASYPAISDADVKAYVIPVPPLPVQSEIVRILDNFTELTTELTMKLTTELTARKKQLEYYRDELFGNDYDEMLKRCLQNNIKVISLNELGNFTRGKRFVRDDIKEEGTPCIHYGDLYTYYGISAKKSKCFLDKGFSEKMRFAKKGDVVIVQAGENDMDIGIGVAWSGDEDVAVHDACYIFQHNINPKYISHYLRTNIYHLQIKKYVSTGKICSISAHNIGKALIPVPPLQEQERIVAILDRFYALCKDISSGLHAEIKARTKQYEYYRDKLLTFKELS